MALIKCPECGKEISDKAEECVHCGYFFHGDIQNVNKNIVIGEITQEKNNLDSIIHRIKIRKALKVLIPILIFCLVMIFSHFIMSKQANKDVKDNKSDEDESAESGWRLINDESELKEGEILITDDDGKKYAAKIDSDYYDKEKDSIYYKEENSENGKEISRIFNDEEFNTIGNSSFRELNDKYGPVRTFAYYKGGPYFEFSRGKSWMYFFEDFTFGEEFGRTPNDNQKCWFIINYNVDEVILDKNISVCDFENALGVNIEFEIIEEDGPYYQGSFEYNGYHITINMGENTDSFSDARMIGVSAVNN